MPTSSHFSFNSRRFIECKMKPSLKWISLTWSLLVIAILFYTFACTNQMIHLQTVVVSFGRTTFSNQALCHNQFLPNLSVESGMSSMPPDLRLLIGVLTLPDHYEKRNLLRLVYGVQLPVPAAKVDLKFVFCNLTKEEQKVMIAMEIMKYNDIVILNCSENMDSGKTYIYFSSLPDILSENPTSKPYDYVMKADDDVYFRVGPLVEALRPLPREDMYYGLTAPCRVVNPYNRYMSGMGYVLSWDIVQWIRYSEIPRNHTEGPEDRLVGEWMNLGGRAKNRHNANPAFYDYNAGSIGCPRPFSPNTIGVHRLKGKDRWIKTLQYFNVTHGLKPSKLYRIQF